MDMNKICNLVEQDYNASVVNFYKYNGNYVLKAIEKNKEYVSFRFFIVKDDGINEIKDKVLIDYFSKGENEPSDIIY